MTARVLVVDDHVLVRQGIVRLLQDESDIEVVGEASNGFEAVNKAKDLEVDIVLMDLYMSGLDGVATAGAAQVGGHRFPGAAWALTGAHTLCVQTPPPLKTDSP